MHGIGHLPSTIIKKGKDKLKKEAANKKKVAANAKKVAENKKKVISNAQKISSAKLLKSKTPLKKAQMGQAMDRGTYDSNSGMERPGSDQSQQMMKKGGSTDKKWIQKAINPKHKGYCTPMTKPTCTPKRKALAKTLKAMAKNRKG